MVHEQGKDRYNQCLEVLATSCNGQLSLYPVACSSEFCCMNTIPGLPASLSVLTFARYCMPLPYQCEYNRILGR